MKRTFSSSKNFSSAGNSNQIGRIGGAPLRECSRNKVYLEILRHLSTGPQLSENRYLTAKAESKCARVEPAMDVLAGCLVYPKWVHDSFPAQAQVVEFVLYYHIYIKEFARR